MYHPSGYETLGMKRQRPERGSHPPGTFYYYNNWDFNTAGFILEQAMGESIGSVFARQIAEPVGMQDFRASDVHYVEGWSSRYPAYPFSITTRDLARFGQLYLQEGRWGDQAVLDPDWVRESTSPKTATGRWDTALGWSAYGYLWWVASEGRLGPDVEVDPRTFAGIGTGGQFLVVIPDAKLVIVHNVARSTSPLGFLYTLLFGDSVGLDQFNELVGRILAAREATP